MSRRNHITHWVNIRVNWTHKFKNISVVYVLTVCNSNSSYFGRRKNLQISWERQLASDFRTRLASRWRCVVFNEMRPDKEEECGCSACNDGSGHSKQFPAASDCIFAVADADIDLWSRRLTLPRVHLLHRQNEQVTPFRHPSTSVARRNDDA